jgi:hypothetical protein
MHRLALFCAVAANIVDAGTFFIMESHRQISFSTGLFGWPPYGDSLQAPIEYLSNGCSTDEFHAEDTFLLVDRGGCSFLQKARNAQKNGASALIVADNKEDSDTLTQMQPMPDDHALDIKIPCIFISTADGKWLEEL